jgi:RimJ/RimL family protein N-acetyltransferase
MDTEIQSDRLTLREINWKDLDLIHNLQSLPEIDRYNTLGIPKSIEDTKNVLRPYIEDQDNLARKQFCWTIHLKSKKEFIGIAGMLLSADRFRMGEIYYNLLPPHWGNGFATEVAQSLIEFGFSKLKLHRIEAGVSTENARSIRVLEKAGMTQEGIRRKILPIRGEWKDNYHYAIVEDDKRDY